MADPEIISAIQEGFRSVAGMLGLGSSSSAGNSSGASGGSAGNAQMTGLGAAVGKAGDGLYELAKKVVPAYIGLEKLTTGADVSTTALGAFKSSLSAVNLGALGVVVDKTLGSVLQWKTDMDSASREMGVGANNLGKFVSMSADAGVTTKQFGEILKNSGVQSLGLGSNAQRGAEAFSAIAKKVQESDIGKQLQDLGMSTKELADITALSAGQNSRANMTSKEAAMAAQNLAQQLDETSRLTGVSRDALAATLKEEEKRPETIALERSMSGQMLAGYVKVRDNFAEFGTPFQKMLTEMASGKLSQTASEQLSSLGPAGQELKAAMYAQQHATDKASKAEADRMMERAKAHVQDQMMSTAYNKQASQGAGHYNDSVLALIGGAKGLQNSQKGAQEALDAGAKKGTEYVAAMDKNKQDAENLRKGVKEDGTADQSQNLSRMLNEANREATVQAKGLAKGFDDLNKAIGPVKDKLNPMAEAGNAIYKGGEKALGLAGKANTGEEAYAADRKIPEEGGKILDDMVKGIFGQATSAAPLPSGMVGADGRIQRSETPGRDGGTLAKTGSPVEPEDAIVKIHKGETVLSPDATKGMGKQLSEGSKAAPSASETATAISSVPAATGSAKNKAEESASNEDTQKWIAIFKERSDLKLNLEKENAAKDIESATQRLARRQDVLADIQETASKRELTEQEKADQERVSQAKIAAFQEQNLKDAAAMRATQVARESADQQQNIHAQAAAKIGEITSQGAKVQEFIQSDAVSKTTANVKETLTINGKVVDPNSREGSDAIGKINEAKATLAKSLGGIMDMPGVPKATQAKEKEKEPSAADLKAQYAKMSTDMNATPEGLAALKAKMDAKVAEESAKKPDGIGYATQQLDKLTGGFSKIGGDMFAPKIVDQKAADAQKAKIAEAKAAEAKKTSEAVPKKSESDDKKETEAKKRNPAEVNEGDQKKASASAHDATLKDLNDQLVLLNKHMVELINHSEKSADANAKTAKATQKATGVR